MLANELMPSQPIIVHFSNQDIAQLREDTCLTHVECSKECLEVAILVPGLLLQQALALVPAEHLKAHLLGCQWAL